MKQVKDAAIVAVESRDRYWHLLVSYDDTLQQCETFSGTGKDGHFQNPRLLPDTIQSNTKMNPIEEEP